MVHKAKNILAECNLNDPVFKRNASDVSMVDEHKHANLDALNVIFFERFNI